MADITAIISIMVFLGIAYPGLLASLWLLFPNPVRRARLRLELLDLQNRFNIPVVLITHDQQDVEAFAKTLVVYDNGQVKQVFPFKKFRAEQPSSEPNPAWLSGALDC